MSESQIPVKILIIRKHSVDEGILFRPQQELCTQPSIITTKFQSLTDEIADLKSDKSVCVCVCVRERERERERERAYELAANKL
jgi:hypothetical protein